MRWNYVLTTLFSFAVLFFIIIDNAYSQEITVEDERIILTVDSLGRTDHWAKGWDFVLIYVHVFVKIDLNVSAMSTRLMKHRVLDDAGFFYNAIEHFIDRFGSEKREEYLEFEMPKDVTPVHLTYLYQYWDETEKKRKKKIKIGQIDIDLLQNIINCTQ